MEFNIYIPVLAPKVQVLQFWLLPLHDLETLICWMNIAQQHAANKIPPTCPPHTPEHLTTQIQIRITLHSVSHYRKRTTVAENLTAGKKGLMWGITLNLYEHHSTHCNILNIIASTKHVRYILSQVLVPQLQNLIVPCVCRPVFLICSLPILSVEEAKGFQISK
jgi:hypothetical protein